jgi:hypothetical protein
MSAPRLTKHIMPPAGPSAAHLAPSFAASISLDLFTPHFGQLPPPHPQVPSSLDEQDEDDPEPTYYTHPCRCSGTFIITTAQLEQGVELIQCDGCTERCRVEYEVLEEEEDCGEEQG